MRLSTVLTALTCASAFLVAHLVFGATTPIKREACPLRIHQTWKGVFTFSEDLIVKIHGLEDLHVLVFRESVDNVGSALIDFAQVTPDGDVRILLGADPKVPGEIPVLEGIDVIPDGNRAEIIVRWRHPGNGGFRMVEKYIYEPPKLVLVARSEFMFIEGELKWISEVDLERKEEAMRNQFPPVREAGDKSEEK